MRRRPTVAGLPPTACPRYPSTSLAANGPRPPTTRSAASSTVPPWVRLTYKYVAGTAWYYSHPETDGGATSCRGTERITACDEWPWQKTEQGGPSGVPLPHLKVIDWRQNSLSGNGYGQFLTDCSLAARKLSLLHGGGNFLVVPHSKGAPSTTLSLSLCHGTIPYGFCHGEPGSIYALPAGENRHLSAYRTARRSPSSPRHARSVDTASPEPHAVESKPGPASGDRAHAELGDDRFRPSDTRRFIPCADETAQRRRCRTRRRRRLLRRA